MPRRPTPNRRARRRPLLIEALESRRLLAIFTVLNSNDDDSGSFRQAIKDANGTPGPDRIVFDVPAMLNVRISPLTRLSTITETVEIRGDTQRGPS